MIDVVIPTHVKDAETLELCIEHVKKNVMNLNKVYIVSKDKLTDNAEWIPESDFPFSLNTRTSIPKPLLCISPA